jgi:hypothetical protein
MPADRDLSDIEVYVANHILDREMETETWQRAVALNALLVVGGYDDRVKRLVDRFYRLHA